MECLRTAIFISGLTFVSSNYCEVNDRCFGATSFKENMFILKRRFNGPVFIILSIFFPCFSLENLENELLVLTVSTNDTDGYRRYMESAEAYNLPVKVLGMGEKWEGGDMNYKGGGHKVNLVKQALKPYQKDDRTIVMFTDSYDVIMLGTEEEIIKQFKALNASIVFSAEVFCWPDESLAKDYPKSESPYKYLNSGGYIGYASQLYSLLDRHKIKNRDDDQLYFTNLFLSKDIRDKYKMRLDNKAAIFQSANGALGELKLIEGKDGYYSLLNEVTNTKPLVLHGNGPSKLFLNSFGNYLAKARSTNDNSCLNCPPLIEPYSGDFPVILMGIFINVNTPFIEEFFDKISRLDYPKDKIHLYVYNKMKYHNLTVQTWISENSEGYLSVKKIGPDEMISEALARNLAIERCKLKGCKYLFSIDSVAHLDDPKTLQWLIQEKKGVVAPMLVRPYKAWSNFWGALNPEGYYSRAFDYMDIVNNDKRGLWNVPYVTHCYLVNATILPILTGVYEDGKLDPDMAFCKNLREKGIFMFVENRIDAGHLVNTDDFDITKTHPEMYEIFMNQYDWEKRYIHVNYSKSLQEYDVPIQPCPDVYWFPIVTPRFCKELINIVEAFGKWSSGSNYDERLAGGYENVPTRDIHMNQVDYERHWLYFLQQYVRPLQEKVFIGYYHDPPQSLLNFVVRYKPDEQPSLRPHHDSSTYTINLALNRRGIDYEGGGCKFLRYNCSITDTKIGWLLMHPGRLTHYHEGLRVSNGTRYIMVSFIDP